MHTTDEHNNPAATPSHHDEDALMDSIITPESSESVPSHSPTINAASLVPSATVPSYKERKKAKQQAKKEKLREKNRTARQKAFDKAYAKRRHKRPDESEETTREKVEKQLDKKRKRKRRPTGSIMLMVIGALFLLFPIISDLYASYQASQAITSYTQSVESMSEDERALMLAQGIAYNNRLSGNTTEDDVDIEGLGYEDILDTTGTGIMGSITIDCIGVNQPVYHGTEEDTLMSGTGHLEGTSFPLPTGATYAAIAGHTGMPGQRMFDELVDLEPGDLVKVSILNRDTWYAVQSSEVVDPNMTTSFFPEEGHDYLTLITCTPYGINDHRLLVHCEKTDPPYEQGQNDFGIVSEDKLSKYLNMRTLPVIVAVLFAMVLVVLNIGKKVSKRWRAKKENQNSGQVARE